MPLPCSLFLALKYLKPKRTFISTVTVISILGVLLGVAVLIIVLSVMTGFDDMWRDKILGFNAHITISGWSVMDNDEELIREVKKVPGVTGAAPYVQGLVFVQKDDRLHTPIMRGIDPEQEATISRVPDHMKSGLFSVDDDEMVVGADMARRLGIHVGDEVLVYSPRSFISSDELFLPKELTISGIFEVGMWDFDMGYALVSMDTARDLSGMESGVNGIQLMTENPYNAENTSELIRDVIGPGYSIQTWMQMNRQLFSALKVEKNMMFFLLIFITVVAAFGITNTLITLTVQKTREIGLLKSLGYQSGTIMRIFLWQGWISGLIGTFSGILVGVLVVHFRNDMMQWLSKTFGWELFPKELYHLTEIPATISIVDISLIALAVMIICTFAGVIPAYRAARLEPARALRYE